MSSLTLRTAKGSPLTNAEVDANFTNLLVALGGANTSPYTVPSPTGTGSPVLSNSPTITGHATIEGQTLTGVSGTGKLILDTSPTIHSPILDTASLTGIASATTLTVSNKTFVGSQANSTRFPNSVIVVSNTAIGIQQNESHNIGIIGEGTASSTNSAIYGIGVYGVGYTANGTRSGGVVGEGHVSTSADTGSSIGVRGYSNDTHAGGLNIGLYGDASNGSSSYSLYLNNGDIYTNTAKNWVMNGDITFTGAYNVVATDFNTTSDIILKENIKPIQNPLSIVNSLNPVTFDWKESKQSAYGLIAQEVLTVCPGIVSVPDENPMSIKYNQLIAILIGAIQQQTSVIDNLSKRVQILEK